MWTFFKSLFITAIILLNESNIVNSQCNDKHHIIRPSDKKCVCKSGYRWDYDYKKCMTWNTNIVVKAWGKGSYHGFVKTPFKPGDYVIVQGCYTYGNLNAKSIIDGNALPISYTTVGTFEKNDRDRMIFYKSIGVYSLLKSSTLPNVKIMGESYYNPNKLNVVLFAYKKIIDKLISFGFKGIEMDNMDFYKVNQARKNPTQDKIDNFIIQIVDYVLSKHKIVFIKNTPHLQSKLAKKATALITESIGDSSPNDCKWYKSQFSPYWNYGMWFDYSYNGGKRCSIPGMTKYVQNGNGQWNHIN